MAVKKISYTPKSGDLILVDLNPVKGHEQGGFRPVLVVSSDKYNKLSDLCAIVPITSKEKGYFFEVNLPLNLNTKGAVLCNQIRTISYKSRKVKFIESLNKDFVEIVVANIKAVF